MAGFYLPDAENIIFLFPPSLQCCSIPVCDTAVVHSVANINTEYCSEKYLRYVDLIVPQFHKTVHIAPKERSY